jgi:hypothetical protein
MARPAWAALFGCFSSSSHAKSARNRKKKVAAASGSGTGRKQPRTLKSRMSFSELSGMASPADLSLAGSNLHAFTIADLRAVTRDFSMTNFVGEGGFGPVYKGYVDDKVGPGLRAQPVAVKLLDPEGGQGHTEWLVIRPLRTNCLSIHSSIFSSTKNLTHP